MYWQRRQDALLVDFKGDRLEPHEVEFVERFLDAGQHIVWIPRDPSRRPTNDFIWVEENVSVELKRTRARYLTIHGRIVDATSRAAKHGVLKENFLIDLGDEPLTGDLRQSLHGFNVGRNKYRLARLWVMTQGRIERIELWE